MGKAERAHPNAMLEQMGKGHRPLPILQLTEVATKIAAYLSHDAKRGLPNPNLMKIERSRRGNPVQTGQRAIARSLHQKNPFVSIYGMNC
ncbi:MAG: hypothetical protein HC878_16565 [Leptolyngbyaceae cyanobacterium SL_5_14]|nr:hypothetical protein [Leptolyngbyaceae cyanobacterium SL_5_14]